MKILTNIVWFILKSAGLAGPVQLMLSGKYLRETGWLKSFRIKQSVDKNGEPIPWCSYPFIQFIEPRLTNAMDVFEYGCGNSTLWFATRVRSIQSVDHDKTWVDNISVRLPSNAAVVYRALDEAGTYSKEIHRDGKKYHVIVIDGRQRNDCTKQSLQHLTKDGVIVFDNTQLPDYTPAMAFLHENGFRRLDFYGLLPIVPHENCTTIFYRQPNCLNI